MPIGVEVRALNESRSIIYPIRIIPVKIDMSKVFIFFKLSNMSMDKKNNIK
jgi:hypothetical protein